MATIAATSCAWYFTVSTGSTICWSLISVGIQASLKPSSVFPVITAATPSTAIAVSSWIFVIFAWAYGLRAMSR